MYAVDRAKEDKMTREALSSRNLMLERIAFQTNTSFLKSIRCLMCAQLLARPRKNANHLIVLPSSRFWAPLALVSCSLARVSKEHRNKLYCYVLSLSTYIPSPHFPDFTEKNLCEKKICKRICLDHDQAWAVEGNGELSFVSTNSLNMSDWI